MKKFFWGICFAVFGLYACLHILISTEPIQQRLVTEIRAALLTLGVELEVEGISVALFRPRLFFNRVVLKPHPAAKQSPLTTPLSIDKIKMDFRLWGLLSRRLIISEFILYHPKIIVPHAEELYRKISKLMKEKTAPKLKGDSFSITVNKVGVVDALVNIESSDPALHVRSRSVSAFLVLGVVGQETVVVESSHLEIDRGKLHLNLTKVDLDLDIATRSIRLNEGVIEGNGLFLNVKGSAPLPLISSGQINLFQGTFDGRVPLALLNDIDELKHLPKFKGVVGFSGTAKVVGQTYDGSGKVSFENVEIDGYQAGTGSFYVEASEKKAVLTEGMVRYGQGEVKSDKLVIALEKTLPVEGKLKLKGVRLEGVLNAIKEPNAPLAMVSDGEVVLSGTLNAPLKLTADINASAENLTVFDIDRKKAPIIPPTSGRLSSQLIFYSNRMEVTGTFQVLQGKLRAQGFVGFDKRSRLHVEGEGLSLTELKNISNLQFGGKANLIADLDVKGRDLQISGNVDVEEGEIAQVALGRVRARAHYRNFVLSFDPIELVTSGVVVGSGFVDFAPKDTHYRFQADIKRAETGAVLNTLKHFKLGFMPPSGGDLTGQVLIEGGHKGIDLEVTAQGEGRQFHWYGEAWRGSQFLFKYRPNEVDVERVLLLKKNGSLNVTGRVNDKESRLVFRSNGLRLEEMELLGGAPLAGELTGQLEFLGPLLDFRGTGEASLKRLKFRGEPLLDSWIRFQGEKENSVVLFHTGGRKLQARFVTPRERFGSGELIAHFGNYDFLPLVCALTRKELPSLQSLMATGDLAWKGNFVDFIKGEGSGTISSIALNLDGDKLVNREPVRAMIGNGRIQVGRFRLVGEDNELAIALDYKDQQEISGQVDGRLDLEYLQPFIPSLESGSGKVVSSLRFTGKSQEFSLIGNARMESGSFRLEGLKEEFRNSAVFLTVSQDRMNIDKFESNVGGGTVTGSGSVILDRFTRFSPHIKLEVNRSSLQFSDFLKLRLSGKFAIDGDKTPYRLTGECRVHEGKLTRLEGLKGGVTKGPPVFQFDTRCESAGGFEVETDVIKAGFKADVKLLGNTNQLGLLGTAEVAKGSLFFRDTQFDIVSGTVRFESPDSIDPRFNISGRSIVKETKAQPPQEYEVNLQVYGKPQDYKIRLSSAPPLPENELISLLLLGGTGRSQEGGYVDFGTTLAGQIPLKSKIQSELGFDIKLNTRSNQPTLRPGRSTPPNEDNVPGVSVQKDITKKTKVSYSSTIQDVPFRELKIEQMLDDNFTVNASAVERAKGSTDNQTVQSYGLDFRYRFYFE